MLALPDLESLPDLISLPSAHFVAFLALNATGVANSELTDFSSKLLHAGCVSFCAWGADCEHVHDVFDWQCLDTKPHIITTWHATDSLDNALWYFAFTAFADDEYADTCRSGLAVSVGRPDWEQQIRTRLGDLEALTRDVIDEP